MSYYCSVHAQTVNVEFQLHWALFRHELKVRGLALESCGLVSNLDSDLVDSTT